MHLDRNSLLFLDSNVFVEYIFLPTSAASAVIKYAMYGTFKLGTSEQAVQDTELAILNKLQSIPERLNEVFERWKNALTETSITIFPDPTETDILGTTNLYLASIRHKADIPILASAIAANPKIILSGNRKHFNDIVAKKCGIPIYSCPEFIKRLSPPQG